MKRNPETNYPLNALPSLADRLGITGPRVPLAPTSNRPPDALDLFLRRVRERAKGNRDIRAQEFMS
jgi:hypothetical protein